MTSYVLTYRAVKGSNLTANEFDANNHNLDDRVTVLEGLDLGIGIDHFTISGNQLSVTMSDSSVLGPYTLPTAQWNWRGEWEASTSYAILDLFSESGALYQVLFAHTSSTSFDAGDNDGSGHDYYQKILDFPAATGMEIADATFTPDITSANVYHRCTNVGGCTITIDAAVTYPDWTEMHFRDETGGAGITIEAPTPASINEVTGFSNASACNGATITVKKVADTDAWDIMGLLLQTTA